MQVYDPLPDPSTQSKVRFALGRRESYLRAEPTVVQQKSISDVKELCQDKPSHIESLFTTMQYLRATNHIQVGAIT